jgi:hypothetical protein
MGRWCVHTVSWLALCTIMTNLFISIDSNYVVLLFCHLDRMGDRRYGCCLGQSRLHSPGYYSTSPSRATNMIELSSHCLHYPTSGIINVLHCVILQRSGHGLYQKEGLSSSLFKAVVDPATDVIEPCMFRSLEIGAIALQYNRNTNTIQYLKRWLPA